MPYAYSSRQDRAGADVACDAVLALMIHHTPRIENRRIADRCICAYHRPRGDHHVLSEPGRLRNTCSGVDRVDQLKSSVHNEFRIAFPYAIVPDRYDRPANL